MENLTLIDWKMVGFASLWILGLAVILSTLSFGHYHARTESMKINAVLKRSGYSKAFALGMVMFCIGLAGSSNTWWEITLWLVLGASFLLQSMHSIRSEREE